ncbi:Bug family tripartite tricarboxylate transporter substrate binding protein [Vibrio salinus]|uniref:Bug family tripartite tricarboxylate transporter substrate binding protein n=1 Tax=Vibrio salinus TaxID=2899784 RepID=UPI001E404F57|nr:tripartite tricarboxylate transporter substrate binding protein [Vibrio salinus]MCE0495998.1 tripartite tricarboxylate transporter substrate binding protein [Vibrio salinus]
MRKKWLNSAGAAVLAFSAATSVSAADYPSKNIQGIIMWGAGGSTDSVMRTVTPDAEKLLGTDVILVNRPGGSGALATKFVNAKRADGYTLLMGAENPQIYKVLGLSKIDYSDMIPVSLLAQGISIFVARNETPYNNLKEFIDYAKAHPKDVKVGSTGPAGLPSILLSILKSDQKFEVTSVPYNGDSPALTALLSGAVDVMPITYGVAKEYIRAGQVKVIGLMDKKPNDQLPGVEPVTTYFPHLAGKLPYSAFFGIFAKAGTPDDVVNKLSQAFNTAAAQGDFKKLIEDKGYEYLGLSGQKAADYVERFRKVGSWTVYEAGAAKFSPAKFNIEKIHD